VRVNGVSVGSCGTEIGVEVLVDVGPTASSSSEHAVAPRSSTTTTARAGRARGVGSLPSMFLGEDLLAYLVLAIGGAMAVGSVAALVRPPAQRGDGDLEQAPVARSLVFAAVGLIGAIWALASLVKG